MRQLPFALAEGVVAFRVFLEQRVRDVLPQLNFLERIKGQFFGWDQELIPALVGQEPRDGIRCQVEIVPAAAPP